MLIVLMVGVLPAWGKASPKAKVSADTEAKPAQWNLTLEQEQQFLYLWYAARQAMVEEEWSKAFALFTMCEAINPNDASTKSYLAQLYAKADRQEESMAMAKMAFELDPGKHWPMYLQMVGSGNNPDRAEVMRILDKASKANPTNSVIWQKLAYMHINLDQYNEALTCLDKQQELEGVTPQSTMYKYYIYLYTKKTDKALRVLEDYIAIDPEEPDIQKYYAQLLEKSKVKDKNQKLEKTYQQLLKLAPEYISTYNNYAYLLAQQNKHLDLAEQLSYHAITAEPSNPIYLDTYAWIMYLKGDITMAKIYITKALRYAPAYLDTREIQKHKKAIESKK